MKQEHIIQIQMFEQEANQLNEQLKLVDDNISELIELRNSLDELEKSKEKDMLANIGKKIYLPVEIREKELIVEVGNKRFVKKSIKDTKKVIEGQIEKLNSGKTEILNRLENLQHGMQDIIAEIEKEQEKESKKKGKSVKER